jgi:FtsH-binding integral membrane protein
MAYLTDGYYSDAAAYAPVDERVGFIRRTYAHLLGAVLAFAALEALLLSLPGIDQFMVSMLGIGRVAWIVVLVAFIGVSYLANQLANSEASEGAQYLGLSLYVVAEAIIFLPLMYIAINFFQEQHLIEKAVLLTALTFGGLTAAVFITKQDFSYLRTALMLGGFLSLGLIIASLFFGGGALTGILFCFLMLALASGYILYDTSNVLHHYNTRQHVAAALALFSSVALLFYYVLRLLMFTSSSND